MKMERLSGITLLEADGANQSEEGAKMNNEFLPAYKVYQQVIDLELYYAFVDLVVHTSYNNNYGLRRGSQPRLFPSQSRSC